MRTTIRLEPNLMRQLKQLAVETHRTLTSVIEDAVREVLARRKSRGQRNKIELPTFKGNGVQPGVDLDDTVSLLDRMDQK